MAIFGSNPQTPREVAERNLRMYGNEVTEDAVQVELEELSRVRTPVTFEGRRYLVPNIAYYIDKPVEFPDGRQGSVGGWLESLPPQGTATLIEGQLFPYTDVYKAIELT